MSLTLAASTASLAFCAFCFYPGIVALTLPFPPQGCCLLAVRVLLRLLPLVPPCCRAHARFRFSFPFGPPCQHLVFSIGPIGLGEGVILGGT